MSALTSSPVETTTLCFLNSWIEPSMSEKLGLLRAR